MTDVMSDPEVSRVNALLSYLRDLRAEKDRVEEQIKQVNAELVESIDGRTSYTDESGIRWTAYVVPNERPDVNLELLRELNEDLYIDATKRVLDTQALKQLIDSGAMSSEIAVQVARIKAGTPYIRFAKHEESPDE